MATIFTTEITSEHIPSDNPIHQRLFKAYVIAGEYVHGDLLEVGCGEGRGIGTLLPKVSSYLAIDKIGDALQALSIRFPQVVFRQMNIPPFEEIASDSFDTVVSFQVIEHIGNDRAFLEEIHRVLRPGGIALLTTPNRDMSLTRNPWHVREYLPEELRSLASSIFSHAEVKGITGDETVMKYHEENRRSVQRLTRWDVLDLQHRLPASWLRVPYEILNRWNRNKLRHQDNTLVSGIRHENYLLTDTADTALDLLLIARK
jgi:SAM-dependent methyltransferase